MWWIYVLTDPLETSHVRYVGQTTKSIATRLSSHISLANCGDLSLRAEWIRKLIAAGRKPLIRSIEMEDGNGNRTCDEAERDWIAIYRSLGHQLLNLTDGGIGMKGVIRTNERKEQLKLAKEALQREGKKKRMRRMKLSRKHLIDEWRVRFEDYALSLRGLERPRYPNGTQREVAAPFVSIQTHRVARKNC